MTCGNDKVRTALHQEHTWSPYHGKTTAQPCGIVNAHSRSLQGGGRGGTAHAALLSGDVHGKGFVLSLGFVLPRRAPLRMYLFGAAKGHDRLRAISKIVKWVPIVLCS